MTKMGEKCIFWQKIKFPHTFQTFKGVLEQYVLEPFEQFRSLSKRWNRPMGVSHPWEKAKDW